MAHSYHVFLRSSTLQLVSTHCNGDDCMIPNLYNDVKGVHRVEASLAKLLSYLSPPLPLSWTVELILVVNID